MYSSMCFCFILLQWTEWSEGFENDCYKIKVKIAHSGKVNANRGIQVTGTTVPCNKHFILRLISIKLCNEQIKSASQYVVNAAGLFEP